MGARIDWLGRAALDAGLAATALTGVAALLMVGCRQPSRRLGLARSAMLGSLALLPLATLGPLGPRVEVVPWLRVVVAPLGSSWPGPPEASTPDDWASWPRIPLGLTWLYLAGVAARMGWIGLGCWAASRMVRRAGMPAEETLALYATLPASGRRPGLRVSDRVRGPALLGVVRPVILIPTELERPEARDRLRMSLLHELAHQERGDPRSALIASLAQAVWFVVPWVWWIGRQVRLDQEFLADLHASGGFGAAGPYATSLVDQADLGRSARVGTATAPPLAAGRGRSALFQRVLMLLRCPFRVEAHAPRWWRWSLPPAAATATLLAALLTFQGPEIAPEPEPSPNMLRIPRLVIAETPAAPDGWAPPHNLLIALPSEFVLDLDVWAAPDELTRVRVAGQRLAPPDASHLAPRDSARWHDVQIRRTTRGVRVHVDDHPIRLDPEPDQESSWLNVQPAPGRIGRFRNIILTW